MRAAIVGYKDRRRWNLAPTLACALAAAVAAAVAAEDSAEAETAGPAGRAGSATDRSGEVLLVPVPTGWASTRRRGYDPVGRLAHLAAGVLRRSGTRARALPLLTHARNVADQAGLDAVGRAANVSGAFLVPPGREQRVRSRRVIVVDDVVTTGATAREAARALTVTGADVPCTAVIAATLRRRSPEESRAPPPQHRFVRLRCGHGTRPGPWLRRVGSLGGSGLASRCQPQAKRPT